MGVTTSEFYFADDMDALLLDLDNHGGCVRNTRTLDNLVGIQNLLFRMLTFFPFYLMVVHHFLILVVNLRHVTDEDLETFFLG